MPWDGPDGARVAADTWARAWRPATRLSVSQWAERNRRLSGKSAAEPGPWKNERIPFLRAIMDALSDDDPCEVVVFMKSAQVGGSECGLNWIGYTIEHSPCPMLALFPIQALGERWSRTRLSAMLVETPSLRRIIPTGRRNDNGNTLMEKDFPDGKLYVGSANVASDVSSVPIRRLLLDEVDRFPVEIENEGDPVELGKRRTATFARRKVFEISTPTIESLSRINRDFEESTQHRYFVPCPHCAGYQYLKWDNVRWPDGEPLKAWYVCEHCSIEISEHHKTGMLDAGEWRATFPERAIKGFHINGLYTPIGLGDTWGENAREYERAKRDPSKLKVFVNTRLGETHKDPREKLDWQALHERREPYPLRTVPRGCLLLTLGVDVQRDRLAVQLVGWGENAEAWILDYIEPPGDPTRDDVWQWLDDYLQAPLVNAFGVHMRIAACAVDSGYLQADVLNFTRTRKVRNVFATKGASNPSKQIIGRPTLIDVNWRGRFWKLGAEQYQIGATVAKHWLYERMRADAGVSLTARHLHFSEDLPEEYYRQVTAETFDPNKSRGWVKVYERNEALDTLVLNLGAAMHHTVNVHRLREHEWQRLRELVETPKENAGTKPAFVHHGGGFMPRPAVKRD
jgi:phage terminase large subunit GpA-like protein